MENKVMLVICIFNFFIVFFFINLTLMTLISLIF
jgi:hypothetical protein